MITEVKPTSCRNAYVHTLKLRNNMELLLVREPSCSNVIIADSISINAIFIVILPG